MLNVGAQRDRVPDARPHSADNGITALGSSLVEPRHSPIQPTMQQVTAIVRLAEGDTIGLRAGQASGVDLELVRGTLSAAFVGS
jgi:hypothetical protein